MEEQFVTYEIALKLKELGFDEDCINFYSFYPDIGWSLSLLGVTNEDVVEQMVCHHSIKGIKAPLWQQVNRWLIDNHDMNVKVNKYTDGTYDYDLYGAQFTEVTDLDDGPFSTYLLAQENGILRALGEINKNN